MALASTPVTRAAPAQVGPYRLLDRLGGTEVDVWRALDTRTGDVVILKRPAPRYARSWEVLDHERTERGALPRPEVAALLGEVRGDDGVTVVVEYVPGVGLDRLLLEAERQGGRLPFEVALALARPILAAIAPPASLGDISAPAFRVGFDGRVTHVGARPLMVPTSRALRRRAAWMSPEELGPGGHDDEELLAAVENPLPLTPRARARADVFAFGALLFELCCGRRAFPGPAAAAARKILAGDWVRPRQLWPELPVVLEQLVVRCLERDPGARPPWVTVADELAAIPLRHDVAGPREVAGLLGALCPDALATETEWRANVEGLLD